jgi:DNA-binding IclR family transcriptional regulator
MMQPMTRPRTITRTKVRTAVSKVEVLKLLRPMEVGRAQQDDDESPSASIKSLSKVLAVLECFSRKNANLTPGEISQLTGLPRATTHRIVSSLRDLGLLEQNKRRETYKLGMKLFQLGSTVLANMDLERHATAHVTQLQRLTGEEIHLCVFDGSQMVFVERQNMGPSPICSITRIEAASVHSTGVGKAFLAYQDEPLVRKIIADGLSKQTDNTIVDAALLLRELEAIRERGFATDMEENEPGIRCVAAPIRDSGGRVFAAISVSGPAARMPEARQSGLAPTVIETAQAISVELGWEGHLRPVRRRRNEPLATQQQESATTNTAQQSEGARL